MTRADLISLAKGALIAAAGAALAYAGHWLTATDLGVWGPTAAAVAAVLVNLARKLALPGDATPPKEGVGDGA